MPRIRTVKPEFWDSPDTAAADLRTRLLYIAMWNWADDYGIGDAIPARIIGFAFPNDDIAAADYPRILADVSEAFGIVFFEHLGRRYYVIPAWDEHQRTEKKAKPKEGLLEAAHAAIAAGQANGTDHPPEASENPPLDDGTSDAGSRKLEREREREREVELATQAPPTTKRGGRLSPDWMPPESVVAEIRSECPHVDLKAEHRKFVDYWTDKTGKDATKLSWAGTWRNWMRRAEPKNNGRIAPATRKVGVGLELANRLSDNPPELTA